MFILSPAFLFSVSVILAIVHVVRCLKSPLRRLPGPALALFTSAILKWHEFRAQRTVYIHRLHKKYGPVVRIAPTEVAFASVGAVKEIYCSGGSGYDKTDFYDLFKVYGRRTMFTTPDKEGVSYPPYSWITVLPRRLTSLGSAQHAKRRRILADRYANSNIMRQPSLEGIEKRSMNFVKLCYDSVGDALDLYVSSPGHPHASALLICE